MRKYASLADRSIFDHIYAIKPKPVMFKLKDLSLFVINCIWAGVTSASVAILAYTSYSDQ